MEHILVKTVTLRFPSKYHNKLFCLEEQSPAFNTKYSFLKENLKQRVSRLVTCWKLP